MFDTGKSKFYKKTNSLLKLLKIRIDAIKKKRSAVNKYLKNDVADLLRNGLDTNAYGRAEGLLVEQNISSCYDFVEQCILCIYNQLSNMQNQRECPSECREAVPSLMHAAARFADLPELRDLRTLFTERYGNSLEPYINKEFVDKLRGGPPSKVMKFRLMQEVAQEYCIQWDSEAFQQNSFKTQAPAQVPAREKPTHGLFDDTRVDAHNWQNRKDDTFPESNNPYNGNKQSDVKGYDVPTSYGRKDAPYDRSNAPSEDEMVTIYRRGSSSQDSQKTGSSTVGSFKEDEVYSRNPSYDGFIQPPYVKWTAAKEGSTLAGNCHVNAEQNNGHDPKAWNGTLKPPPGREMVANGKKEHEISPHLHFILNSDGDQSDEEEKKLDQLLMRYSNKKAFHESSRNTKVYPPGQESDYASDGSASYRSARGSFYPPPGQESDDSHGAARHRSARTNLYPPPGQESDDAYGATRHKSARANVYPPPAQQNDDIYRAKSDRSARTDVYPPVQESGDPYGATKDRSARTNVYPPPEQRSDDLYGAASNRSVRTNIYPPPGQESEHTSGATWHRSSRAQYPSTGQESHDGYGAAWNTSSRGKLYPPPAQQSDDASGSRHRSKKSDLPVTPGRATSFQPTAPYEQTRRHARTNSHQEMSGGHVHPKLPDYDDLFTRLGALKGR